MIFKLFQTDFFVFIFFCCGSNREQFSMKRSTHSYRCFHKSNNDSLTAHKAEETQSLRISLCGVTLRLLWDVWV